MQMIGWLMIALFVWLFPGPWLPFKRAVDRRGSETPRASEPDLVHHLVERRACWHHGGTVHL